MLFSFLPISTCLLISAVLADPRRGPRHSHFNTAEKHINDASGGISWTRTWAGAELQQSNGTFRSVTGTFTVPSISGPIGAGAAALVGIDGGACNMIFEAGVIFNITSTGPQNKAVWEWYPDPLGAFPDNFTIAAGDSINVTVSASNATSGLVEIQNLSNQQSATQRVQSSHALCGQSAEWIVEDYLLNDTSTNPVPLANFGKVVFTHAQAGGPGNQTFGPQGSTIVGIEQNGQYLTNVSVDASSVVVKYVKPTGNEGRVGCCH
ncbi:peptidase A4 family-domain-containing protein [Boletus reticuloceps]|uniref:Peptidase A4 family-domain-containing protein n=1 Tax=Boletus reticuloceps TaxID=495285 RepID=A0A8I3A7P4_9AGAM|nr:peptidase A4 family-domain-containing protein [Boletus reticuloceps]